MNRLYLSATGEKFALLLIGDTITMYITDLKKLYYITNPVYNFKSCCFWKEKYCYLQISKIAFIFEKRKNKEQFAVDSSQNR